MEDTSELLWRTRYRDEDAQPPESGIEDTWKRVARSVASVERDPDVWSARFYDILCGFRFLPAGRILAGAGSRRQVTLFNCFVMGAIEDSLPGIFEALKEGVITMQQGGGVGYDFSTLRPHGARAVDTGAIASGPVSFMKLWDAACATLQSTGTRGGAMMATLRCDHPDIEAFIDAKRAPGVLTRFNLSVLITDAFMDAVKRDLKWPLLFSGRTWRTVRARELWERLCASAHECAEPGVLFIDRINQENNLGYCETLHATNPCGEEPLPAYGACNLGSLNLTQFVLDPFTPQARMDDDSLRATARVAVRFLDDVIDLSRFPLPRQREQVRSTRRLGLGITGLADALVMLGIRYDSVTAHVLATDLVKGIRNAAYEESIDLAREKAPFPALRTDDYLKQPFITRLPEDIRSGIRKHGIRNSHLLAIAPAASISLLAGNVSSGIEPLFGIETVRRIRIAEDVHRSVQLTDRAYALWHARQTGWPDLPESFVSSLAIAPRDHLLMQAAVQPYIDGSISKTLALDTHITKEALSGALLEAYDLQLKGCTVFREGSRPGILGQSHLTEAAAPVENLGRCCDIEREADC
jgi:ribonucleoside-diphosphate reductase alpha chain